MCLPCSLLLKQPKQSYKNHTLQQTGLYEFIYKTAFQCTVVQPLWFKIPCSYIVAVTKKKKIVWSWMSMLEGLTSFKKKKSIWHRISTDVTITSKNTISPGVANCLPESREITKPKFQFTVNSNISHFWLHVKKKNL